MKYKPGKGRKPRRQQKVYKRKTGGPKFLLQGKPIAPSPIAMMMGLTKPADKGSMLKNLLLSMGFRSGAR